MPSIEPNRPTDQANANRFAEVRLRFQKIQNDRTMKQIAQLEEQRKQMKLEINRLKETVEATPNGSDRSRQTE